MPAHMIVTTATNKVVGVHNVSAEILKSLQWRVVQTVKHMSHDTEEFEPSSAVVW